ncbi:BCL-6 corepressor-like protein 1 [Amphibalanus amphitrite]|uniref:BCL-6 corepressor-like protein 1 n=1 Tax=Amphibalanus amphitrite TaxID=1232801 RepID=UPI001C9280FB|nr:BCL-6 corepressor-like protein 1 [Amphibalanus amphitrite]XP_043213376.1 BCL-6 corepressor-like protein 1 [Amphibalanus amphitrite]XP_043213377.1 BCL-6 corepressor-like protein 1 [Amphibalanus amphitrite]XP_043213378.1 BCL-6 corepressor-like protein 1 [Amphibalanus amphitrite]XP_043213379.1 BCL-6 corepressor-like protein 1 [Amphibalanus amphitrite]XP_043213380.1 BCL-6 corepressor-like protein 1 [Amphibalanus amphitrite]XP_043213382.1 BCL-6 corepressor-like protein 1 [Amphibalanus amphitrit
MSGSDLDRFMLACSDLNQPAKSRLFQNRPGLKDIKVQSRPTTQPASFQTSVKARDWSQLDLGDAFSQAAPPQPAPSLSPAAAPQSVDVKADSDWDEFDEFQSCPPPPAPALSAPLLAPTSLTGSSALATAFLPPAAGLSQNVLQSGPVPSDFVAPPSAGTGWPPQAEPVAAAAYTPVPAVQPAAKPTRFRQGLVPFNAYPKHDGSLLDQSPVAEESAPSPYDGRRGIYTQEKEIRRLPTSESLPPSGAAVDQLFAQSWSPLTSNTSNNTGQGWNEPVAIGTPNLLELETPSNLPPSVSSNQSNPVAAPAPSLDVFAGSQAPAPDSFSAPLVPLQLDLGGVSVSTKPEEAADEDFGEFVSVERPSASGASSRHGSLPSLDLQVAPAAEAGEVSPLEPDRRDTDGEPAAAKPDKYDSIRQEVMSPPTMARSALVAEWRRCLQACYELIQEGVALFGSVDSQRTCSEVAGSRQGARYMDNLSRVYRVASRIERACERHSCVKELELVLSETCKAWANLTSFVANSPAQTASEVRDCWSEVGASSPAYCGVCLLPAEEAAGDEPTLACAGHQYHACCANLWVNRVADVLPALRP